MSVKPTLKEPRYLSESNRFFRGSSSLAKLWRRTTHNIELWILRCFLRAIHVTVSNSNARHGFSLLSCPSNASFLIDFYVGMSEKACVCSR